MGTSPSSYIQVPPLPRGIILDLIFVPSPCEKVVNVPDTNCIIFAIRIFMMGIPSPSRYSLPMYL